MAVAARQKGAGTPATPRHADGEPIQSCLRLAVAPLEGGEGLGRLFDVPIDTPREPACMDTCMDMCMNMGADMCTDEYTGILQWARVWTHAWTCGFWSKQSIQLP